DLRRVALERVAAARRDRARDDEHPRARDVPGRDRLLDPHVPVTRAFRLDVPDRREALLERAARGDGGPGRAKGEAVFQELGVVAPLGGDLALEKDVRVA